MDLLVEEDIPVTEHNDDTLGRRTRGRIAEMGTNVVLGGTAVGVVRDFGFPFVSQPPMTYSDGRCAIDQAVDADSWEEIGVISDESETKNRKLASYRCF